MAEEVKKPTGQMLVELLQSHLGEKYQFGAEVPKDKEDYKGPWDCAEFLSWAIFQLTKKLIGVQNPNGDPKKSDAYSGYFKLDASKGKAITFVEASKTPGAIFVRNPSHDITGHVVISDGKGGTIEAHSTKDGVVNLKITGRRWDVAYILPDLFDYEESKENQVVETPSTFEVLFYRPGSMLSNPLIKQLKIVLEKKGYQIDYHNDLYDYQTMMNVREFQLNKDLLVDGEVGPETSKALGFSI